MGKRWEGYRWARGSNAAFMTDFLLFGSLPGFMQVRFLSQKQKNPVSKNGTALSVLRGTAAGAEAPFLWQAITYRLIS